MWDKEFSFSYRVYDVIDSEVQKYSSTSVYGGENGTAVNSSTHYHSDQGLWVKDEVTGKERKFEFSTFNVSARPGHKLLCVWHEASGAMEAVANINTDDHHVGIRNFSKIYSINFFIYLVCSVIFGLFFLYPYAGPFIWALLLLFSLFVNDGPGTMKSKVFVSYIWILLASIGIQICIMNELITHYKRYDIFQNFPTGAYLLSCINFFSVNYIKSVYVKKGRAALKTYLTMAVNEYKEKSN